MMLCSRLQLPRHAPRPAEALEAPGQDESGAPSEVCQACGGDDDEEGNEILLCDGEGCSAAFHMMCLEKPLAMVPEGDWLCPACCAAQGCAQTEPSARWAPADECGMALGVGDKLWACDRRGFWAEGAVVKRVEAAEEADAGGGSAAAVVVKFKGFSAKLNEQISVGAGRLRPCEVGPPPQDAGVYVVERVVEVRTTKGRPEYLTTWVGYDDQTWEPAKNFVGEAAKAALAEFRRAAKAAAREGESGEAAAREGESGEAAAGGGEAAAGAERGSEAGEVDGADLLEAPPPLEWPGAVVMRRVEPLPPSGTWIFLHGNHPVADRPLQYMPLVGEEGFDADEGASDAASLQSEASGSAAPPSPQHSPSPPPPPRAGDARASRGGAPATKAAAAAAAAKPAVVAAAKPAAGGGEAGGGAAGSGGATDGSLLALFCRRCFTYDCSLHGVGQPVPRWRYAEAGPAEEAEPASAPLVASCTCQLSRWGQPPAGGGQGPAEVLRPYEAGRRTGLISLELRHKQRSQVAKGEFETHPTVACDCDGPCDSSNPNCVCVASANFCEPFCACGPLCANRWKGCHCKKGDCRTSQCPCWAAGRECDPDICHCAASEFTDAGCEACMPKWGGGEEYCMPCDGGAAAAKADVEAAVPCRNMGLLLREHKPLLLGPSQVAGWGLFSHGSIERQELVTEYVGELVSHEEADRRGQAHGRRRRRALPTEPSPQPARTLLRRCTTGARARTSSTSTRRRCLDTSETLPRHFASTASTSTRRRWWTPARRGTCRGSRTTRTRRTATRRS